MEKSKIVRKVAMFAGGISMVVALPACGVAGIMNPTERSPRPDPAVESGEVENPVEIENSAEDDAFAENPPKESPPDADTSEPASPDGNSGNSGGDGEFQTFAPAAPVPGLEGPKGKGARGGVPAGMLGSLEPIEDGVRQVGEAGEVEFRVEDGVLSLMDVSANSGWEYQLGKKVFDEAKVFFVGEDAQWEFGAEMKEGRLLEVETKQEIPFAEPGSYDVGDAGEVSFSAQNGGVVLDDYGVADGWNATVEENDFEDVHVNFYDESGAEYKFEAEFDDDGGSVEVKIDHKERGSLAAG